MSFMSGIPKKGQGWKDPGLSGASPTKPQRPASQTSTFPMVGLKAGGSPPRAGGIATVTEHTFEDEVLHSEIPVLLEFSAEWCAPCKQIAPELEAFAQEMTGKVKVVQVDVDRSPVIAQQLRVQSVPTFMVFANQRVADMAVGAISRKKMKQMVERFLPRAAGALKPAEVSQLLQAGVMVAVDTREAVAYQRTHIKGAVHIPFEQIESNPDALFALDGQPVVYCRAGDRTKDLAAKLDAKGTPVAFIEGGLLGWEAEGLAIERP